MGSTGPRPFPSSLTTIRCSGSSAPAAAAANSRARATSTPSSTGARGVLWDSSAILALLDADDADHARAMSVARRIASDKRTSFITNYVEAEAHALLLRKLGRAIARQWLLTGGLPVVLVTPAEEQHAKEILARHTDKDWTLCDALSFAVLDARGVQRAFTFDQRFRQYGRIQVLGLPQRRVTRLRASLRRRRRPPTASARPCLAHAMDAPSRVDL